jgi:hypothetical protein
VATVYPFNRLDGGVSEVLMLDVAPESRILTVQNRRPPAASIRLQGSTLKVWTAGSLFNQKPLLVVHDVVKHFQLEDGRLFLWRIADDAFVAVRSTVSATNQHANQHAIQPEHANYNQIQPRWTEDENLVPSLLDPVSLTVTNLPLKSTYGRGRCPFEWMDMGAGCVAAAFIAPPSIASTIATMRIHVRLFDFVTGSCFRESSCLMPQPPEADGIFPPLSPEGAGMLLSRNSDADYQVIATAVLYDYRVFRWRLRDFEEGVYGAAHQTSNENVNVEQPSTTNSDSAAVQYSLHHIFTTPDFEPITDVSISTTAGRIYVLGLENLYILGQNGVLQQNCSMLSWRGVDLNLGVDHDVLGVDVGAFSWPLPNSTRTAFYLDITNSLFVCDFRAPNFMENQFLNGPWGPHSDNTNNHGFPPVDHLMSWGMTEGGGVRSCPFYMQSHVDLRPPPRRAATSAISGRLTRPPDSDPVIVEYVQSGEVLMTVGDSSCPSTAALLWAERAAKTYLEGLGPSRSTITTTAPVMPSTTRKQAGSARRGQRSSIAPRALILIDTATGKRFKAIPVDGTLEAVHSAGHYVVMAVAELDSYPDGPSGSIVVLDFSGQGFGSNSNPVSDASRKKRRKPLRPEDLSSRRSRTNLPPRRCTQHDGLAKAARTQKSYNKSRHNPKPSDEPDTVL